MLLLGIVVPPTHSVIYPRKDVMDEDEEEEEDDEEGDEEELDEEEIDLDDFDDGGDGDDDGHRDEEAMYVLG